jgi:hypothetical protein
LSVPFQNQAPQRNSAEPQILEDFVFGFLTRCDGVGCRAKDHAFAAPPFLRLCCMKDEQRQFLSLLGRVPARLTTEQTAWFLNCELHDIPVLVAGRLLKPLGNSLPNGHKFFATAEVLALGGDRDWLSKATQAVQQYWQRKNARKTKRRPGSQEEESPVLTRPSAPLLAPNGRRAFHH